MLKMAGKKLTTLLVKAEKVQLQINNLEADLAQGLYPPSFAPKEIPLGEATKETRVWSSIWGQLDQLIIYYGYSHRQVKWWRRVFFHLLDLSIANEVLYTTSPKFVEDLTYLSLELDMHHKHAYVIGYQF